MDELLQELPTWARLAFFFFVGIGAAGTYLVAWLRKRRPDGLGQSEETVRKDFAAALAAQKQSFDTRFDQQETIHAAAINGTAARVAALEYRLTEVEKLEERLRQCETDNIHDRATFEQQIKTLYERLGSAESRLNAMRR